MKYLVSLTFILLGFITLANKRTSELYVDLLKLNSLNRVLYIAAHPDDENTRLLAYLSLGENAETAYLSLTRGDGGQNLIGDELGYKLGVLRTQELLAARSYDKANQFFSRAVDFGYSKSASESLVKWGENEILSDVVKVIRKFKPDIIITRFPPDKRGGHGHHTASAMLAIEAFEKAADPEFIPEQVKEFGTWETSSIYWNTSYWWVKDIADSAAKYPDKYFTKDIGKYNPILGMSYNEIGTIARSQHKCQGFGAILERGSQMEYFEHLAGKTISEDFFEHNPRSWSEVIDATFEKQMNELVQNFDFLSPDKNVPALVEILKTLEKQEKTPFMEEKIDRCENLITNCLGLYIQVTAEDYSFVAGEELKLKLYGVNRSSLSIAIQGLQINGQAIENLDLSVEAYNEFDKEFSVKSDTKLSTPYWLVNDYQDMYVPTDMSLIGAAQNEPTLNANIILGGIGHELSVNVPVEYIWRDPSYGEKRREVISTPALTTNFENDIIILKEGEAKTIRLNVHAFKNDVREKITLKAPQGWQITPAFIEVDLPEKHSEKWLEFTVEAGSKAVNGDFMITDSKGNEVYAIEEITYDHIPTQSIVSPTKLKAVKLDAQIESGKIAYVKGVDDAVPDAIQQLGFELDVFEVGDLATVDLKNYRSVVLGIRIYNVYPELFNYHDKLFTYVEGGGNLVMQYNTASSSIRDKEFGPKPFKLSRNRVTEEDASVSFLVPDHQILNSPNKITQKDFNGWVQERGLYFAGEWANDYQALLSWNDKGEEPVNGGLIVLQHGKGQFVYTGVSFFRELPNGVVGAYRLFANILSYGAKG